MEEYYCIMPTQEEIARAYPPLSEEEKQRDESALEISRKRDRQLDNAVMDMWSQIRKACWEHTSDHGGKFRPRILDIDPCSIMVVPQACDTGKVRFVTVNCFYDLDNIKYAVEINGTGVTVFYEKLNNAVEVVKKVMYDE